MKNRIISICIIIASIIIISCDSEVNTPGTVIPSEIKAYLATHFPTQYITNTIKDAENYEITLSNTIKLKFNLNNVIIDIEGLIKLPDTVIPDKILTYVNTNYPNNYIIGWELDDINQKIELDNEIDIKFNMNGEFLMIDLLK